MTAKIIHTLESIMARTVEVGDCMEWQGHIRQDNVPYITVNRQYMAVRRLILQLIGKPAKRGNFVGTTCGNQSCVNPEHIIERSRREHMRYAASMLDHNDPTIVVKQQRAVKRLLTPEDVEKIRFDERSATAIAAEVGCCRQVVSRIRRGTSHRIVNASVNPFAGLMR